MNNIWAREKDYYKRRPIKASSDFSIFKKNDTYYSDEEIDSIRQWADIVDFAKRYLKLKRNWRTSSYYWLCPFHQERTASFAVNPARQIFHCFGCWCGWNIFTFAMRMEWISFWEALNLIKKTYKIKVKRKYWKVYKDKYFEIILWETRFWKKVEYLDFLQDETSQRVKNLIYQRIQDNYDSVHWKSLSEVLKN